MFLFEKLRFVFILFIVLEDKGIEPAATYIICYQCEGYLCDSSSHSYSTTKCYSPFVCVSGYKDGGSDGDSFSDNEASNVAKKIKLNEASVQTEEIIHCDQVLYEGYLQRRCADSCNGWTTCTSCKKDRCNLSTRIEPVSWILLSFTLIHFVLN